MKTTDHIPLCGQGQEGSSSAGRACSRLLLVRPRGSQGVACVGCPGDCVTSQRDISSPHIPEAEDFTGHRTRRLITDTIRVICGRSADSQGRQGILWKCELLQLHQCEEVPNSITSCKNLKLTLKNGKVCNSKEPVAADFLLPPLQP